MLHRFELPLPPVNCLGSRKLDQRKALLSAGGLRWEGCPEMLFECLNCGEVLVEDVSAQLFWIRSGKAALPAPDFTYTRAFVLSKDRHAYEIFWEDD